MCISPERRRLRAQLLYDTREPQSTQARLGPLTRAANYQLLHGLEAPRHRTLSFMIKNINACRKKKKKKKLKKRINYGEAAQITAPYCSN